jgi:hypothetical protein
LNATRRESESGMAAAKRPRRAAKEELSPFLLVTKQ